MTNPFWKFVSIHRNFFHSVELFSIIYLYVKWTKIVSDFFHFT